MAMAMRRRGAWNAPRASEDDGPPPSTAYRTRQAVRKPPAWPVYGTVRPSDGELMAAHYDTNERLRACWARVDATFWGESVEPEEEWTPLEWGAVGFLIACVIALAAILAAPWWLL